jgi:hypothetical protein
VNKIALGSQTKIERECSKLLQVRARRLPVDGFFFATADQANMTLSENITQAIMHKKQHFAIAPSLVSGTLQIFEQITQTFGERLSSARD